MKAISSPGVRSPWTQVKGKIKKGIKFFNIDAVLGMGRVGENADKKEIERPEERGEQRQ